MLVVISWCIFACSVESAVLDPSLYLSPGPPLTDVGDNIATKNLWSQSTNLYHTRYDNTPEMEDQYVPKPEKKSREVTINRRPMERAKLFWPSIRPSHSVAAGSIQIPLTFSLSGIYGKYAPGTVGSGIIGSSYATVLKNDDIPVSSLASSIYGNHRTYPSLRVYGRENGPTWSGWGNGKWGHYGKG